MFYYFSNGLLPNSASANRCLSFLKGFDELGVEVTFVLLKPFDSPFDFDVNYQHVKIEFLWKEWPIAARLLNRLYRPISFRLFLSKLHNGDTVFCDSSTHLTYFISKKNIRVFHERTESPEVLPLRNPKSQSAYLEACKRVHGLFVISTALKKYFVDKGVSESKIHIINMTVDSNRFLGLKKNNNVEKYIAYCGTASNNKDGVDELIKAFSIVAKKYNDIKLYIIGKAPTKEDESGNLLLIESLGIQSRVVFTGVVPARAIPQLLKNAIILALDRPDSIQAQNGFPTKLGEYLLTGNPVVVTKVGDIPLFLKDGQSALLAEQRDSEDFAARLCWLLEHPAKASLIGEKGLQVAMVSFNYLLESQKIINIINA